MHLVFNNLLARALLKIVVPGDGQIVRLDVWPIKEAVMNLVWSIDGIVDSENTEGGHRKNNVDACNDYLAFTELQVPNLNGRKELN